MNYQSRSGVVVKSHAGKKNLSTTRLTILANHFVNAKSHVGKTPVLAGYVLEKETTYYQSFGILLTCQQLIFINVHLYSGNFEKCVTLLRDKHKSKDLAPVVQSIFSHESVVKKNQLTIKLIVSTKFNLY